MTMLSTKHFLRALCCAASLLAWHANASDTYETRSRVLFEGNDHYDEDTLLTVMAWKENSLLSLAERRAKIRLFYVQRGFLDVEVHITSRHDSETGEEILFVLLREHARVRVTQRIYLPFQEEHSLSQAPCTRKELDAWFHRTLLASLPNNRHFQAPKEQTLGALTRGTSHTYASTFSLDATQVYDPDVYKLALEELQTLYQKEGFLEAKIGPLQIQRAPCSAQPCRSLPSSLRTDMRTNLLSSCTPSNETCCNITLLLPICLGPRTFLRDILFQGVQSFSERHLAETSKLVLEQPMNRKELENARQRIQAFYQAHGYLFATVKSHLEMSSDRTHAHAVFEIQEHIQPRVRTFLLEGNRRTPDALILRRVALQIGQPYYEIDINQTRRNIAKLGSFSSVTIALDQPHIEEPHKVVRIGVVEQPATFVGLNAGVSTGDGIHVGSEMGMFHLWRRAATPTLRLDLSYLPSSFIYDETFREKLREQFGDPGLQDRLVVRALSRIFLPDVGLGMRVTGAGDLSFVRDLQRQFALRKTAIGSTLYHTVDPALRSSFRVAVEHNDILLLGEKDFDDFLQSSEVNADLKRLLRIPNGKSIVLVEHISVQWDTRDQPFSPRRGFDFSAGIEHIDAYPLSGPSDNKTTFEGHFLKLTQEIAGYLPFTQRVTLLGHIRLGQIVQLTGDSKTYPDRLFFLGGADSLRGYLPETLIPQDIMDTAPASTYSIVRGGNWMINPRTELRVEVYSPFLLSCFLDTGNIWMNPWKSRFRLQSTGGMGLRVRTPLGHIGLDYGINLTRRIPYEDFGALNLAIGSS